MSNYQKNSKQLLLGMLILLPLIFTVGCEDYEEQTFVLSELEQLTCDRLADTMSHEIIAADLTIYGPHWTGKNMVSNLASNERIGISWYDSDFLPEADVFFFTNGADTSAAMQILSFVYDEAAEQVDSLEIAYLYNAVGNRAFGGLVADTILALGSHTNPIYIDFSQGFVTAADAWNISIDGAVISLGSAVTVSRQEGKTLASVVTAPGLNYVADGVGYTVSVDYLSAQSAFLTEPDSLLAIELEADEDAGYLLWDRTALGSAEIIFNATDYLTLTIWDASGVVLQPSNVSMSPELIAYCNDLKTKKSYELDGEVYLIQFLPQEEMDSQSFSLVIVEDE